VNRLFCNRKLKPLFLLMYSNRDALRHELSRTHYRILMRVENPEARSFAVLVCNEKEKRVSGKIQIMPWRDFCPNYGQAMCCE